MEQDDRWPQRRSVRLRDHDYAGPATYFITICTSRRAHLFGTIADGVMTASETGARVADEWASSLRIRREARCHAFVVMPNHVHGLVSMENQTTPTNRENRRARFGDRLPRSVPALVAGFKAAVTRSARSAGWPPQDDIWQRGFHEHIVRDDDEFERIEAYIRDNPARWHEDRFNPQGHMT